MSRDLLVSTAEHVRCKGEIDMMHYIAYEGRVSVSLAAIKREYIETLMEYANNLSVTRGVLLRPPVTLEAELAWFEKIAKGSDTDQVFAILLHEPPIEGMRQYRYIGHCGLHHITWPDGMATSGSLIIDPALHGKGHGTEAKLLLLYHAFFVKGLRHVRSEVKAFNGNSWGHLLKAGYREAGRFTRCRFDNGTFVDEVLFEILREQFEPIWHTYQEIEKLPTLTSEQRKRVSET